MLLFFYVLFFQIAESSSQWNFTRCPEPCRCYSEEYLNIVDCSHLSLEQFPPLISFPTDAHLINMSHNLFQVIPSFCKNWFPNIVELDLSNNKLEDLKKFGGFENLKRLNLANNRIQKIPDTAIKQAIHLKELDLAHNWISHISKDAFKNLHSLHKLVLNGNRLQTLPTPMDSNSLRELYVDDNSIENVSPELLNYPDLRVLSLARNKIVHMDSKSLENCQKLEILNLAQNRFLNVPKQALHTVATSLVKLNLSSVPFKVIKNEAFTDLPAIREIDLSNSKIVLIGENSFRNLPNLSQLYLNDNPGLIYILNDAFRQLPSLSLLHLHNCNLSGLYDLTKELSSVQELTVYGNPLVCDCHLDWLQRFTGTVVHGEQSACISDSVVQPPLQNWNLNLSTSKMLQSKCAPRLIGFLDSVTVMEGEQAVLFCGIFGDPKLVIRWRTPCSSSASDQEGRYILLKDVSQDDAGTYRCEAHSDAGFGEAQIFLNVIPHLEEEHLHMKFSNSTLARVWWSAELPTIKSRLRILIRDKFTKSVKELTLVDVNEAVVEFDRYVFSPYFEFCLLDGTEELACNSCLVICYYGELALFDPVFLTVAMSAILFWLWLRMRLMAKLREERWRSSPDLVKEELDEVSDDSDYEGYDDNDSAVVIDIDDPENLSDKNDNKAVNHE